jgi:Prokaryotic E2 family E
VLQDLDRQQLDAAGHRYSTYVEGELTLLVIRDYEVPGGYSPRAVDLLLQIPRDYPDAALDMWWVFPEVRFERTSSRPTNTDVFQPFAGFAPEPTRQWQRFSRHPQWRLGVDDLRSYLASLHSTMENEARRLAA